MIAPGPLSQNEPNGSRLPVTDALGSRRGGRRRWTRLAAMATVDGFVGGYGTTITGQRPARTSRTAIDPITR